MSKRRHKRQQKKFPQTFYRQIFKLFQAAIRGLIKSLLRSWYRLSRQFRFSQAGFVLPTITVVLLIFSIVVGSLLFGASQRTTQVIGERENQVIYNAATPAIERAKAKLEYLFQRDKRFPVGVPSEAYLKAMMLNIDAEFNGVKVSKLATDPYTFPDETRIDVNPDKKDGVDNAWSYKIDSDGDGNADETIAYSLLMNTEVNADPKDDKNNPKYEATDPQGLHPSKGDLSIKFSSDEDKAANLLTRTGPLSISANAAASASCKIGEGNLEQGWFPISSATVRKNFQVNAVVTSDNTVTALEFQQDRQLDKGNKFGAWFRYDLFVHPGPQFNWNGAMHTDGSLIGWNDKMRFFLVSSPESCIYTEDAAEITINQNSDPITGKMLFQGQAISDGTIKADIFPKSGGAPNTTKELKSGTDSVEPTKRYDYTLDPLVLFTEDRLQSRYSSDKSNLAVRDSNWDNSDLAKRITNKSQKKPYIDDTYRADNRWGPKPTYGQQETDKVNSTTRKLGSDIATTRKDLISIDPPPDFLDEVGVDGYWERRAYVQGLRVIVGQRLELGNAFGWKGNNDPLYPPQSSFTPPSSMSSRKNEYRQQQTLRDNLAAVQSTVVYHYKNSLDFPVACLATTAHPGTLETIKNSTTFENETIGSATKLKTDFFTGKGTNGWEFNPPRGSLSDFKTAMNDANDPLRTALKNLAYFAGDPDGAFPPKQETSGSIVHPYPWLTMWGDFSNLRRVIDEKLDKGTDYDALSIADKSTLHTASCTLGMLAYNIDTEKQLYDQALIQLGSNTQIQNRLDELLDLDATNGEVNLKISPQVPFPSDLDTYSKRVNALYSATGQQKLANFYNQFTPKQYQEALKAQSGIGATEKALIDKAANVVTASSQIKRDRTRGFALGGVKVSGSSWNSNTGVYSYLGVELETGCDPQDFASVVSQDKVRLVMALTFCGRDRKPKYPSLYYLFPVANHGHDGTAEDSTNTVNQTSTSTEEYINDPSTYISSAGVNNKAIKNLYKAVEPSAPGIALTPQSTSTGWKLPITTSSGVNKITTPSGDRYVAFLDKGMYNGRQLMAVRTLAFDLNLLRNSSISGERWLPNSGIVYAFREDAVREDGIARPAGTIWNNCNTEANLTSKTTCQMNVYTPQDPPVNKDTGISPKPIDFVADPGRRPHGFRLSNGARLDRDGTNRGLSFISDNSVYIRGDFNLHNNNSGKRLEEFGEEDSVTKDQLLKDDWSNFYSRKYVEQGGKPIVPGFAKPTSDRWRPTEILSDAITVLSNNFCDGTVESGIRQENNSSVSGCNGSTSSFLDTTLKGANNNWILENDSTAKTSSNESSPVPIKVTRNGALFVNGSATAFNDYRLMKDGRPLNEASETRINTIFVGAITPSRENESYGGLHNYPRFNENWQGKNSYISGSFIQLNFSVYGTASYDQQNAFEPAATADDKEDIKYYSAPDRRWGYDVALLYNPPGPIAARLFSSSTNRSEIYQELAADDPYIKRLRCAKDKDDKKIDPNAKDCPS